MKLILALLAATTVAAADHQSLRHAPADRVLTQPFDQQAVVDASESGNRNEPCIPGEFDNSLEVIDADKKQFPTDVKVAKQCRSSCDCEGRCCSNYPYYISLQSHFEGNAADKGGVCVNAFNSGYTDAATNPTCLFGLLNQASDGGEIPVDNEALDDPTVGGDNGEDGVVTILPVVVETAPAVCEHNGVMIPVGEAYTNQCNACQCVGANLAACQTAACAEADAVCDFKGGNYWAGEQFMDECNTCTCNAATDTAGPSVACTLVACPQPLSPSQ